MSNSWPTTLQRLDPSHRKQGTQSKKKKKKRKKKKKKKEKKKKKKTSREKVENMDNSGILRVLARFGSSFEHCADRVGGGGENQVTQQKDAL